MIVLIIGSVWPEPESSAAGLRDWNLIDTFMQEGWNVAFACGSKDSLFSDKLKNAGITTYSIGPNDPRFDDLIVQLKPDYVVFDRFITEEKFGWRIQESSPNTIRILDTQDLHFLRRSREKAVKDGMGLQEIKNSSFDLVSETTLRELGSIYRSDCTLILSSYEKDLLESLFHIPSELLFLSRFHYDDPPKRLGFEERCHFTMIGNFRHAPNRDAILWLRNEIWPLIRKELPDANVHIYGAYPSKEMMNLDSSELGFRVLGSVENQFSTLEKYRINLAPLRFGAGIKGKITDGWWSGTPVISTEIGAEGMTEGQPWGGCIAIDARDFAKSATHLYLSKEDWTKGQEQGFQILRDLYSKKINSKALIQQLLELKKNIKRLRASNMTGAILNYHLYRSTKYFSKWIEAKTSAQTENSPEDTSKEFCNNIGLKR